MAPRITDPRAPVRTSSQQLIQDVRANLTQLQNQLKLLDSRSTLTTDQIEAVAADLQRLRDDVREVRVQTNPGVSRAAPVALAPSSQVPQESRGKQAPLRVAAVIEADQEGPQNQPVVRGSIDASVNVWKVVAIVSALIALAQSVLKALP
jgi:septal ring factor EnvC (AmiA/AmiB activator)